jgi:hypothetical protein
LKSASDSGCPEALAYETPASRYEPSLRAYPRRLPEPEYPAHFRVERASPNGVRSFGKTQWCLTDCLAGEFVGLEQSVDGLLWADSSSVCWIWEARRHLAHATLGCSSAQMARSRPTVDSDANEDGRRLEVVNAVTDVAGLFCYR